ncbi:28S ribosomal protein S22, mitochondrial [Aphelenchoides bicaudatus]|nr:28S ribosomal protein S22, mitochondrial [Aphelenchoides bicaudatus]
MLLRSLLQQRAKSAWIASTSKRTTHPEVDTEKLFIEKDVQDLLYSLTGIDLHGKLFRERIIPKQERSHYALMTDKMFQEAVKNMENKGRRKLQFVPFKEPRPESFTVLAKDPEISGFDTSKFIFTDITFDATNRDRLVVVREPDGTLRTALPEEHDRMNRVYYAQPHRPVIEPKVFSDPHLQNALDLKKHEFVLDWACYFFEPDDPAFVRVSRKVFDDIIAKNEFDLLHSTRHFGSLAFYMILNDQLATLLRYISEGESLPGAANAIRLHKLVYRTWQDAFAETDSDRKVVEDFFKQNPNYKSKVRSLVELLNSDGAGKKFTTSRHDKTNPKQSLPEET